MEDTVIMIEVRGVANNNPATGAPSFHGILQTGGTLTADTSSISDADGPASPGYTYQWIEVRLSDSTEKDIKGATGSTYELVSQDVDRGIKLRLSFTDDAGNTEILNSRHERGRGGHGRHQAPALAGYDDGRGDRRWGLRVQSEPLLPWW